MQRSSDAQIDDAIRNARATLAMEGLHLTEEEEALIRARLQGELTDPEFLRLARERALRAGTAEASV